MSLRDPGAGPSLPDFLIGGGEMGALMRAHDWSTSPLGAPATWPQSLRAVVALMINSRYPMFVAWGDELAFLYNDGYVPIFGKKHPRALGLPFREVWSEIWDDVGPLVDRALAGEATFNENMHLVMERNGFPEDTWYSFSYSPVRDESGAVAGMFCACTETTQDVLAERRRAAERERLARMFEQAPGFITILQGPDHVFEFANAAYRRVFGDRNFVGKTVREAFPELADQGFFEILDRVYATGERFVADHVRIQIERPGAPPEDRLLDFIYEPVTDETGRITGIFCEGHDVTEQHRTQAELRDSESRLRLAIEGARLGTWDWDLRTARGSWSPRTMEILGVDVGEGISPRQRTEIMHPDDRERVWREFADAMKSGNGLASDYRVIRPDGEVRWIVSRGALEMDDAGTPIRASGIVLDVTERFAAETRLRESEARFRILLETAPALIFATDAEGRNSFVNERYQRYTGLPFDELCGDGWQSVVHPDDRSAALAESVDMLARPRPMERRMRIRRHDGEWRWFLSRTEPVLDVEGNTGIHWLGVSIDIEEQVRAEERERLLAQEVDHRAKNLLAVVQSIVQLTRADDAEAFRGGVNGRIQALARSHGLLAAARWEGVDLQTLVDEELAAFAGRGAEAVRIAGPAIRLRPAAAQSLGLVLHELATNAAKHGSLSVAEGRLDVTWLLADAAPGQRQLELRWREHGGPAVSPTTTRGFGSTVIRASVERQLKGEVAMDWRPEGLVCDLVLPAEQLGSARTPRAPAGHQHVSTINGARHLEGLPVLVVEDEVLIAMQIEDAVVQAGGAVVGPASSVAEAVDLIVAHAPAAAVLDVNLGGGERSFAVADILLAKHIPFAFCTGYAGVADLPERFSSTAVLSKPLDQAVLVQTLDRLVRKVAGPDGAR